MPQIPTILFYVAAGFIVAAILYVTQRRERKLPNCPNCESGKVVETGRETVGSRTVQPFGGGLRGGGSVRVQLEVAATYRCQKCSHVFERRFTETH